jgi:hypothetical protein
MTAKSCQDFVKHHFKDRQDLSTPHLLRFREAVTALKMTVPHL